MNLFYLSNKITHLTLISSQVEYQWECHNKVASLIHNNDTCKNLNVIYVYDVLQIASIIKTNCSDY